MSGHINLWRTGAVIGLGFVLFLSFWPIADNRDLLRERAARQSAEYLLKDAAEAAETQSKHYAELMQEFSAFQNEHACVPK